MHLGALWSEGSVTDMGPCRGQYKGYDGISLSPGSVPMVSISLRPFPFRAQPRLPVRAEGIVPAWASTVRSQYEWAPKPT